MSLSTSLLSITLIAVFTYYDYLLPPRTYTRTLTRTRSYALTHACSRFFVFLGNGPVCTAWSAAKN